MPARLVLLAFLAVSAFAQPKDPVFEQVDEMVGTLSEITGWQVHKRVPAEMLSADKFRKLVETGVKKSEKDKAVRIEELTLKMFGFVPQDYNLAREAVDLVSEQAAAFYDYKKKRLYVLETTPEGAERQVALAHELAHALADQQHHLGKYLTHGSPNDDAAAARQAVVEGQANWLSFAYLTKRSGGKGEVPAALVDRLTGTAGASGSDFPVFSNAPLYIRESLTFPYNEGLRFQDSLFHKLGRAGFDRMYTQSPVSTQQILHPDAYLSSKEPSRTIPPSAKEVFGKDARRYRKLAEGELGEFDHSVLLRQFVGETRGARAASHWRGAAYHLYESKGEKFPALVYVSEWDSVASAREFYGFYQQVLKGKWRKLEISSQSDERISGAGDSGRFQVRISGTTVQSIEGLR